MLRLPPTMFLLLLLTIVVVGGPSPSRAEVPGSNGKIAFSVVDVSMENDIWVMNADGTGETQLTSGTELDDCPAWSPDGSKIAFQRRDASLSEIWVMDADGSSPTNLTNGVATDGCPTWSPNGTKLAFQSLTGGYDDIWVMNADGTLRTNLTNNPSADDRFPSWSPDGEFIAFESTRDGNHEIYVMTADGSGQTNITMDPGDDRRPAWSPDGIKIAFSTGQYAAGFQHIMSIDFNGDNLYPVTRIADCLADECKDPAWSPDGTKIVYKSGSDLHVVTADHTYLYTLTTNGLDNYDPHWQPQSTVVNSTGDGADSNVGDGICDDGSGDCTLRAAIQEANHPNNPGVETINFDIPGAGPHTIAPGSALPTITDPVIINGTSEPDYAGTAVIELDGSGAGAVTAGLVILAGDSIVRGLMINNFGGHGIQLHTNGSNIIQRNFIGTDAATGTSNRGNTGHGILIQTSGNLIGSRTLCPQDTIWRPPPPGRNTIAFNGLFYGYDGVFVDNGASGNSIVGNNIYDNGMLGIDIYPDGQDLGMNDAGLRSALYVPYLDYTTVTGYIYGHGSHINEAVWIDVFVSDTCDPSGHGEGQRWATSGEVVTDPVRGNVSASGWFDADDTHQKYVTTTATYEDGTTSEFANCVQVYWDSDADGILDGMDGWWDGSTFHDEWDVYSDNFTDQHIWTNGTTYADLGYGVGRNGCLVSAVTLGWGWGVSIGANCAPWAGPVQVDHCGTPYTLEGGESIWGPCGSSSHVTVDYGPVIAELGTMEAILPTATTGIIHNRGDGSYEVTNDAGSPESITAGGLEVLPGETVVVSDGDIDGVADAADNCPGTVNPGQENGDGDEWGDACDNCPDTTNSSQENADGDPWGDACDECPSLTTAWHTPIGDDDCDGFISADETFVGTDPNDECGAACWPPDFNDDNDVDIFDINLLKPTFFSCDPGPPYDVRFDLKPDDCIDIFDINRLKPFFFRSCTP